MNTKKKKKKGNNEKERDTLQKKAQGSILIDSNKSGFNPSCNQPKLQPLLIQSIYN